MEKFYVRSMKAADLGEFKALDNANPFGGAYDLCKDYIEDVTDAGYDCEYAWGVFSEETGKLIGYCTTFYADGVVASSWNSDDRLIGTIYVDPEYRNQGAAKLLIEHVKKYFTGCKIYVTPADPDYDEWWISQGIVLSF